MAYGFQVAGPLMGLGQSKVFTNSATAVAVGDLVNLVSGVLTVADAGDFVCGVVEEADSASGDVSVNISPFLRGYMDNDNDGTTFASTHVGYGFDITGATGAMVVDTSSADNTEAAPVGQLVCLEYNPQERGFASDTSIGLFMIVEHQFYQRNI